MVLRDGFEGAGSEGAADPTDRIRLTGAEDGPVAGGPTHQPLPEPPLLRRWRSTIAYRRRRIVAVVGWSVAIAAPVLLAWQFRTSDQTGSATESASSATVDVASETSAGPATEAGVTGSVGDGPQDREAPSDDDQPARSDGRIELVVPPTDSTGPTSTATATTRATTTSTSQVTTTTRTTLTTTQATTTTTTTPTTATRAPTSTVPSTTAPTTTARAITTRATTTRATTALTTTTRATTALTTTTRATTTQAPLAAKVLGFRLVAADSGADLGALRNGQRIDTDDIDRRPISVVASVSDATASVRYRINGTEVKLETLRPFSILGDRGGSSYVPWRPGPGTYTIRAIPYGSGDSTGPSGEANSVTITVVGDGERHDGERHDGEGREDDD